MTFKISLDKCAGTTPLRIPMGHIVERPPTGLTFVLAFVSCLSAVDTALAAEVRAAKSISCAAADGFIMRDGELVLRYPSRRVLGLTLYNRYVSSRSRCDGNEYARLHSVITANDEMCALNVCRPRSSGRD